ncbi:MAG: T9SS type A sorting domain-containing protein [Candidatus Tenebribacter burtonii]|nr:T9SS type A sorting domain-containing protein [Candidatus Tenebribacter burtonii]
MKKLITFLFIIFIGILFANPIIPVCISELSFEDDNWTLEIYDYYQVYEIYNLDGCYLATSTDTAHFNYGITFNENEVFVVDEFDLQSSLIINLSDDTIVFGGVDIYFYDEISWGNNVNPPFTGQSLGRIDLNSGPPIGGDFFLLATENQPSMGSDPFFVSSYGTFTGYVYDSLMNPVENVQLEYCPGLGYGSPEITTDENGYFNADLPGMNYDFHVHLLYLATIDAIVTIEPDTQNYYEFIFENYVSSDDIEIEFPPLNYNLTNYPNPFNPSTTISFNLTTEITEDMKIQIFNSKGQNINQFSIFNDQSSITWDGTNSIGKSCPSGVYFYKLVSHGKELAVNKMLLLK